MRLFLALAATTVLGTLTPAFASPTTSHKNVRLENVPRYDTVILIEMENRQYDEIIGAQPASSPHMTALAARYNVATQYYSVTHPSEPNYISLMAGNQEGILDDDPWYCQADGTQATGGAALVNGLPDTAPHDRACAGIKKVKPYVAHHFTVPNFFAQLNQAHISWSMYLQSVPTDPKTGATIPQTPTFPAPDDESADIRGLYASKHNPADNFDDIRGKLGFLEHNRTETAFFNDLTHDRLPRFAYFVPDQCHDDHGPSGPMLQHQQCIGKGYGPSPLLTSGDNYVQSLVDHIQASPLWRSRRNAAIIILYDEDDSGGPAFKVAAVTFRYYPDNPIKEL
ncbi:alkaline phosphatase family protein [Neokomagataea anthophila]|uniref:Acid phosphatase n=1 Tax=Neokomagataea anthophila TaxID=2826925 RepID=A0ABS5E969_9PROT|nr:alkaline phosphatase family protein [Neokomagataea anthophila]MBR0560452.1 hypothetical protein [Neokomagataea anthophila]